MKIRALIVEDEEHAILKLRRLLAKLAPDVEIIGTTRTVDETRSFLDLDPPDLIFSDIHLLDGLSIPVYLEKKVQIPIIFTTAFDQYAMDAFKTYSIDYILKPVSKKNLSLALDKFRHRVSYNPPDLSKILASLKGQNPEIKRRFLVQLKDQFISLPDTQIAYFYADGKHTLVMAKEGRRYFVDMNISQLDEVLDPTYFFRVNRKYIIRIDSIVGMQAFSKSRLKIDLEPHHDESVIVSVERSPSFKNWLGK